MWSPPEKITLTKEMTVEAQRMADAMGDGRGRRGSILEGGGDFLGCLGEVAFREILRMQQRVLERTLEIEHKPNPHYDLDVNEIKIDVKTKWAKTMPQKNWEGSVAMGREDDSELPQNVDVFAFMRILYHEKEMVDKEKVPGKRGWFIGWLPKEDFYRVATPIRKGEIDPRPSNTNQFKSHKDQWNVYHYLMNRHLMDLVGPELF
tara:strand:+ start:5123 stop:5737 length:615 start_codon:yes stop_codon:yes gene_type:complete